MVIMHTYLLSRILAGQHSTLVQLVLMLSINHSLAKACPTMRCIHLVKVMQMYCPTCIWVGGSYNLLYT